MQYFAIFKKKIILCKFIFYFKFITNSFGNVTVSIGRNKTGSVIGHYTMDDRTFQINNFRQT